MVSQIGKRAGGYVGGIILFGIFFLVWFAFLGGFIQNFMHQIVIDTGMTGTEAFLIDNLAMFITIFGIMGITGWLYFGRPQQ